MDEEKRKEIINKYRHWDTVTAIPEVIDLTEQAVREELRSSSTSSTDTMTRIECASWEKACIDANNARWKSAVEKALPCSWSDEIKCDDRGLLRNEHWCDNCTKRAGIFKSMGVVASE